MKFLILVLLTLSVVNGARILAVFPHPSHSHQVVFKAISKELANRGHEVIIFTTSPDKTPHNENYTEVSLESINTYKEEVNFFTTATGGAFNFMNTVYKFTGRVSDETLANPVMQQLLSANNTLKIDLILVQCLFYDALYSLSYHFDAPMIGLSSLPMLAVHYHKFGNPFGIAYAPDTMAGYTNNMTLWERIVNAYYVVRQVYEYETIVLPDQEVVVRKYFGDKMPPVRELIKRMSLLFASVHPFYNYPHPTVPGIIPIVGCRKAVPHKEMPKNLQAIFDEEKKGVIYFSLGSNLKSIHLPNRIKNVLLETFAELPYTILWKFEADEIQNKPKNVITKKWLPQQEILAHPKTVLFMYQGGLQSTEEVTKIGLPLLGFPMFSDQIVNMKRLSDLGAAKWLDLINVEKNTLKNTILELITNPSYKRNALKLRDLLNDTPLHPMDNAIWWVEHVIRHKGASHLYNKSRDMPLYQTLLLDIVGIFIILSIILLYGGFIVTRFLLVRMKHFIATFSASDTKRTKKQQ